ncbi:thioesterase II family protein [Streptomyces sp. NPDC050504]|uniref:thioesterase II family protein n=1 Tax=Streptomyces sp. NPDC050504 TaxID=3365618 RepID=UPI00378E8F58
MTNGVQRKSAWIQRFHPSEEAGVRLVCFPHAGGAATYFHPVSAALSPDIEVLAVQYPGRQERRTEPVVRSVEELARQATEAIRPWAADRPLAFFGHSMGALVAAEAARNLAAEGAPPLTVIVSGRRAPTTFRDEDVHRRDDAGIVAEMARLGGSDTRIFDDPEMRTLLLPVIRADYEAVETYRHRPGPPLPCPLLAVLGDDDPVASVEEARGWAAHTSADFRLKTFPGGHFYLNDHAAAVIATVRDHVLSLSLTG